MNEITNDGGRRFHHSDWVGMNMGPHETHARISNMSSYGLSIIIRSSDATGGRATSREQSPPAEEKE